MVVKINSMFQTAVHFFVELSGAQSKLSRVNLYRNDLKGNKNYFELAGGLSY